MPGHEGLTLSGSSEVMVRDRLSITSLLVTPWKLILMY